MDFHALLNTSQVVEILAVQDRQFRYWDSLQLFTPKKNHIGRPGKRKKYPIRTIIEAGVVREFDQNNIAVTLARKAVRMLAPIDFDAVDFCWLIVSGEDIEVLTEDDVDPADIRKVLGVKNELTLINTKAAHLGSFALKTIFSPPTTKTIIQVHDIVAEVKFKIKKM